MIFFFFQLIIVVDTTSLKRDFALSCFRLLADLLQISLQRLFRDASVKASGLRVGQQNPFHLPCFFGLDKCDTSKAFASQRFQDLLQHSLSSRLHLLLLLLLALGLRYLVTRALSSGLHLCKTPRSDRTEFIVRHDSLTNNVRRQASLGGVPCTLR
eukprot:gnl/Spiro4/27593_TR13728_c0_g1_i1.p1 gnl/Spiro4/27593_TR13728_c0_g1~~gnl/Spiro4/27593_TR13728_c0_g1_i1.p1  ORF type:complete len:179 (-),score=44.17 gnl/Spiro4/27593_TR13728_c0_g1_i1:3-470(-)